MKERFSDNNVQRPCNLPMPQKDGLEFSLPDEGKRFRSDTKGGDFRRDNDRVLAPRSDDRRMERVDDRRVNRESEERSREGRGEDLEEVPEEVAEEPMEDVVVAEPDLMALVLNMAQAEQPVETVALEGVTEDAVNVEASTEETSAESTFSDILDETANADGAEIAVIPEKPLVKGLPTRPVDKPIVRPMQRSEVSKEVPVTESSADTKADADIPVVQPKKPTFVPSKSFASLEPKMAAAPVIETVVAETAKPIVNEVPVVERPVTQAKPVTPVVEFADAPLAELHPEAEAVAFEPVVVDQKPVERPVVPVERHRVSDKVPELLNKLESALRSFVGETEPVIEPIASVSEETPEEILEQSPQTFTERVVKFTETPKLAPKQPVVSEEAADVEEVPVTLNERDLSALENKAIRIDKKQFIREQATQTRTEFQREEAKIADTYVRENQTAFTRQSETVVQYPSLNDKYSFVRPIDKVGTRPAQGIDDMEKAADTKTVNRSEALASNQSNSFDHSDWENTAYQEQAGAFYNREKERRRDFRSEQTEATRAQAVLNHTGEQNKTAHSTESPASASALVAEVMPAILQHLENLRRSGRNWMKVSITLPNGKSISLQLRNTANNQVQVRFGQEAAEIRDSLLSGWTELARNAAKKGLSLSRPEFEDATNSLMA
ncbi:MAG: hypothetical protein A2Y14_05470 [Verrucomicrobia bacterium GWF2_51_19]|nr:MAG: hypothetical protein A2Y14_05470 [Verrucomicrobia bacterium GWF2_51_19]